MFQFSLEFYKNLVVESEAAIEANPHYNATIVFFFQNANKKGMKYKKNRCRKDEKEAANHL